ncbi:hypothetical protein B0H16DRAFT_1694936 [Mycena metata]|uniref:F-box domain-containing protein n=1 Tax=Mycena metata TaxID=1033252 RepID=A0AAD7I9S7_9AGAR|nr:hypothetical protein B0H16DRAFT_1694936 [Mycena metata]
MTHNSSIQSSLHLLNGALVLSLKLLRASESVRFGVGLCYCTFLHLQIKVGDETRSAVSGLLHGPRYFMQPRSNLLKSASSGKHPGLELFLEVSRIQPTFRHSLVVNVSLTVLDPEMLRLPPELLELVLSALDSRDLWVLIQVSRFFQQLALPSLLSSNHITPSQIHSGSDLPHAAYPATYGPGRGSSPPPPWIPLIPDVMIWGPIGKFEYPGFAEIVATLSRGGRDSIVVASNNIDVSHFRYAPPIQGIQHIGRGRPWTVDISPLAGWEWLLGCIMYLLFLPFGIIASIIKLLYNLYLVIGWTYRRVLGPPCDQARRIDTDFHIFTGNSMCIQTIFVPGAAQFTLLTFPGAVGLNICFCRLRGLSSAQLKALLMALDYTDPASLIVNSDCGLDLHAVLAFAHRHPSIENFILRPGSLDATSLHSPVTANSYCTGITSLSAPAQYIPHIWPFMPSVTDLEIHSVGDASKLADALATIAVSEHRSPGLSALLLDFVRPAPRQQSLPWRSAAPPPLLRGIAQLRIYVEFVYSDRDAEDLPRWLVWFPDLERLELRCSSSIPVSSRAVLAESIAATRADLPGVWAGVGIT